jgi:hypothetical protein
MTQDEYILILFADCGFHEKKQQNGFMSLLLGRTVQYIDELNTAEKSRIIEALKFRKKQLNLPLQSG